MTHSFLRNAGIKKEKIMANFLKLEKPSKGQWIGFAIFLAVIGGVVVYGCIENIENSRKSRWYNGDHRVFYEIAGKSFAFSVDSVTNGQLKPEQANLVWKLGIPGETHVGSTDLMKGRIALWWSFFYDNPSQGTFSISGDKIELKYKNGKINVHSYSCTENTIDIDGVRFIRRK